jgi:mannose-1-phosphate guanylyltransferase
MNKQNTQNTWAIVLAAGEGTRLSTLTTDRAGVSVPKQYCSLLGGASLLEDALHRAAEVVPAEQVMTIVAQAHRRWWNDLNASMGDRLVAQPANRGTGHGILLALLHVLERDPDARVLFLPSDHYVRDEQTLAEAMRAALAAEDDGTVMLLGITPEEPDPELGYIVQGPREPRGAYVVRRFIEKPETTVARHLVDAGCLWNSFIFAARGRTLLALFEQHAPQAVARMQAALQAGDAALAQLYSQLAELDFSRHVLQRSEEHLRVWSVPRCGWDGLGTPRRLAKVLRRMPAPRTRAVKPRWLPGKAEVSLALAHARLQLAV